MDVCVSVATSEGILSYKYNVIMVAIIVTDAVVEWYSTAGVTMLIVFYVVDHY